MSLKFPEDLSEKYFLSISFYEYSRPSPYSSLVRLTPLSIDGALGGIKLPIPANIQDALSLNWEITRSAPVADLAASALGDVGGRSINARGDGDYKGGLSAMALNTLKTTGQALLNQRGFQFNAESATDQALQLYGLAQNPALTVLFKHPHFKKHSFTWKFSPNDSKESETLTKIINTIKYHARPGTAAGGAFFSYPSIAVIAFSNNTHLYSFQESVITDIAVHYAPVGVPAFHSTTSAPAIITVTINFMEIILNTRENFNTNTPNNLIGNSKFLSQLNKKNN